MSNYNDQSVDQYMRKVLREEFSTSEADNALTALSTLTSLYPDLFPYDDSFVRPDHQQGVKGAAGVRFEVYDDKGVVRFLRIPRHSLSTVKDAVDTVVAVQDFIKRSRNAA